MRARLSLQGGHRRWGKVVDAVRLTAEAAMVPFAALLSALSGIPDPRRAQGKRYPLAHLLLFSVLAVLAGATSYRRTPLFMRGHRAGLNAPSDPRFRPPPAVNTLRALLHALDPAELEAAFRRHAEHLGGAAAPAARRVIFPPWRPVYGYMRAFADAGVWEAIRHPLVVMLREREGKEPSPSAV